ncbi:hypothetical protein ACEPAH_312 [Sanghuangporus vaninii]
MSAAHTPKGFFSARPAGWKKPGQPGSPNLDAAEKAQAPQRITADGPERPKKSCTPQKIAFRTFIQPYKKRYASCKVIAIIVTAIVMVVLIIILLLFCGVFQEAKERAESHAIGEVLQDYSLSRTPHSTATISN